MNSILHRWRLLGVFCSDMSMVFAAWFGSVLLYENSHTCLFPAMNFFFLLLCIQISSFYFCGLYRGVWRFASIPDLIRIIKAVGVTFIVAMMLSYLHWHLHNSIIIIYAALLILFLSAPRLLYRWLKDYNHWFIKGERVLIIGAGNAGEEVIRSLRRDKSNYHPIAFVDDDSRHLGQEIHGIRVRGTCQDIPKLALYLKIDLIIIAVPSASAREMRRIVNFCEKAQKPFRTLSSIVEIATGKTSAITLRDVSLEDLLGREQVNVNWEKIYTFIINKVVLVTGGGGSIGEELCLQIAMLAPACLIIIESSEFNLYAIDIKLRKQFPNLKLHSLLCNITDKQGIKTIFNQFHPKLVFHAAAYKHVPLLESQIRSAVYNNLIGTRILAEAAVACDTETFVLISSDKAVNPSNIMGATKRGAEIFCQNLNNFVATHFITVRFGNVLDSAGSVIPLFRKQLEEGGPLTVTHPEITRFFMTIPEASRLIMQAASMGKGGEIFVLEMGEPIKISYLAKQLIKLSGKKLGSDIDISPKI